MIKLEIHLEDILECSFEDFQMTSHFMQRNSLSTDLVKNMEGNNYFNRFFLLLINHLIIIKAVFNKKQDKTWQFSEQCIRSLFPRASVTPEKDVIRLDWCHVFWQLVCFQWSERWIGGRSLTSAVSGQSSLWVALRRSFCLSRVNAIRNTRIYYPILRSKYDLSIDFISKLVSNLRAVPLMDRWITGHTI